MIRLTTFRKDAAYHLAQPIVRLLARTPVTPDALTWFGFLLALGAAALVVAGYPVAAGIAILVASFFDMLDGALARHLKKTGPFGAVLDSTLDRLAEAALLLGIMAVYAREQSTGGVLLAGLALVGSLLVSYTRARAEALGLECQTGLFTRAERVVVLALGLLLSQIDHALVIALVVIAVFSFITVGQRLFHVWKQTRHVAIKEG
ncbi:MAG: CDP-alcohol phosphatidyltransferase family protein [Chloroflexi bacterium]|nr:CDP-alcohol phosphatidyltransferase family protein [Chloroflexota bacterium]